MHSAPCAALPSPKKLGITWQVGVTSGWGVYGLQIVLALLRSSRFTPVLFNPRSILPTSPLMEAQLAAVRHNAMQTSALVTAPDAPPLRPGFPVLHALGNELGGGQIGESVLGEPDVGLVFLEDTAITHAGRAAATRYRTIVAGSSWNGDVLKGAGFGNVVVCPQGIDPTQFHPAPRLGSLGERFVVFSGGKLEHRKGQDIVIEAFRRFRARHPEALLIAAWHNHWPETAAGIACSPWVTDAPEIGENGQLKLTEWLSANGIPPEAVRVIPALPQVLMGGIMREADVALFPNRCEGGTNLVAMEALACGVPTILSANTGHLDLLHDVPCLPLTQQKPVSPKDAGMGTDGWGESSAEEIVEHLETVYSDRVTARQMGARAAARMLDAWTWNRRVEALLDSLALDT